MTRLSHHGVTCTILSYADALLHSLFTQNFMMSAYSNRT